MQSREKADLPTNAAGAALDSGVGVLRDVFGVDEVAEARRTVLEHADLMKNTRPNDDALHLAGFHRHPELEHLHLLLTGHPTVRATVRHLCGEGARTIGLSDITVNRSQPWHKDLLRGRFRDAIGVDDPCARWHGSVFKCILYLQPSASLQFIAGSHRRDIPLETDDHAVPDTADEISSVNVGVGDLVVMDVCTTHRGADHATVTSASARAHPRILVSTVFGTADHELTGRLELGNARRLADWMRRNG